MRGTRWFWSLVFPVWGAATLALILTPRTPEPPPEPPPLATSPSVPPKHAPVLITDTVLAHAEEYSADWVMWAKTYRGQRYSPLAEINRANVTKLAPKWAYSLGTHGAQQCTPVVHRGVMYVTGAGGKLHALRADTGDLLWSFDSKLPADTARFGSDTNRGVAIYRDLVIWCNFAGEIFAHNARTGTVVWKRVTADYRRGYTRTLAPLIVKGRVILGSSGGEFGVRGFVEALDAATGKPAWRTHTIPAPGEAGNETWPPGNQWEHGGAPTWVTGSYDPELNLIYWTTGNGAPWSAEDRPGDNLYTCCVLALDADTGERKWHFQFVPNDDWDYDCNATPILAEIQHGGERTPILAVALKSGFIYVIDRRDGRFLKGAPFADTINWAKGLDPSTGRPIETGKARPRKGKDDRPFVIPSALGAANWWATAFDAKRGNLIVVGNETGMRHVWDPVEFEPGKEFIGWAQGEFQDNTKRTAARPGRVSAWNLETMKKSWEAPRESEIRWGGPLVTGGDLVFSGTMRGFLQALDAENGKPLWQFQTGSGIMAHPVTYAVDGKQYVALLSGRGGVANPTYISRDFFKDIKNHNSSGMVFAFALP
ncbi:MAG: pyrroloquinoline quinone-dependent dehydrogenase [Actinomycetota bacterium]